MAYLKSSQITGLSARDVDVKGFTQAASINLGDRLYSEHEVLLADAYNITGDVTISDNLILAKLSDDGNAITLTGNASTTRTISGSGSLEGSTFAQTPNASLTGMAGTIGSAVTNNAGVDSGVIGSGVTGGSGLTALGTVASGTLGGSSVVNTSGAITTTGTSAIGTASTSGSHLRVHQATTGTDALRITAGNAGNVDMLSILVDQATGSAFDFINCERDSDGTPASAFKVTGEGNVNVEGNLVIGTSGKGIDFGVTANGPGSPSEVFNDYEEGSWTPTGTNLHSYSSGIYCKIGNMVFVRGQVRGNGTAQTTFGGLPFAPTVLNNTGLGAGGVVTGQEGSGSSYSTGDPVMFKSNSEFYVTNGWQNALTQGQYATFIFNGSYSTTE